METRGRESRKTVTVLFCDVVHSTGLAEGIDPEALRQVMSRYFEHMQAAVEAHGGTVEKFIGDEVMAVFGVPVVHEDDALRAVRCAADMHQRLDQLNTELHEAYGLTLQVRIGINTGEVVAGDPTGGHGFITGEPVVLAKRLEQAAAPGDILVGKATYPLIKDAVTVGPLERFAAKGKRDQAERRRVDEVDPLAAGVARRLDVPMVGRERELSALREAFERAVDERTCRLFTVLGHAGIGKSRLAAELATSLGDRATTLTGRCLPYGEGITFWPLAEIIWAAGGEEALSRALAGDDDVEVLIEIVQSAIGASAQTYSGEETFWAVRRTFEAMGSARPLVVVLEDIHWAEPTFLDLIEYVLGWSRGTPILLVCLARPELVEARPTWIAPRENADAVALDPLSASETEALLDHLGSDLRLLLNARGRIAKAAEGNPLFVEQMVAIAAETDGDGKLAIPPTIQALLAERLDRLDASERRVLERASVIGRDFALSDVARLAPPDERNALASDLLSLVRKGFVQPETSLPAAEDRFRFHHVLVRDAAYGAMPKEERAMLHERLADSLEGIDLEREFDELVGYHLEQAFLARAGLGLPDDALRALGDRAAQRLASAGRRALARGDALAAAGLLQRAGSLSDGPPERTAVIQIDLGAALREAGRLDESEQVLGDAIRAGTGAADQGVAARATIERAWTRVHRREGFDELRGVAEETSAVLVELGDDAGIAKALTLAGQVEYLHCRVSAAEERLERALVHAGRAGDRAQERMIVKTLARATIDGPLAAAEAIDRIEKLMPSLSGDHNLDAVSATSRAPLEAMRGRFQDARALYRQGLATLEELGRALSVAGARLDSGMVELLAGDARAAERELRASFAALHAFGETSVLSSVSALLGEAVLAQGREQEAERYADVSAQIAATEDVFSQVEWRTLRAKLLTRAGRPEQAQRCAHEAIELMREADTLNLHAAALAALGEAQASGGRSEEARASLAEAGRLWSRKGNAAAMRLHGMPA